MQLKLLHVFDLGYIHHVNQELLEYFPNYDYHQPKNEYLERLKFSHPDNLVGHQQRCFNYYWASRKIWVTGLLGVEIGSGGMKTPYCLSTNISIGENNSQTEMIMNGCKLPFIDGSVELLLANHVLEHIHQPIEKTLLHWIGKLRLHGVVALIVPDGKYCDVLALDSTHKHSTHSTTFKDSFLAKLSKRIEILEYDTLDNGFSFNIVFRKIE